MSEAVTRALRQAFGVTGFDGIAKITKGHTSSLVFRIIVRGSPYLLKIITRTEDPNPAWYGHSIGRWDGDTLVVDRVGFDPRVWLDVEAHPHSDKLHIIERYHRPDLGHMEIQIMVDDAGVLVKPWTQKRVAELAHEEIFEYICQENNRDAGHMVGK